MFKSKKVLYWILFLILIEQSIKIIINNCFLNKSASIIPHFLYFEPLFNKDYSWVNSLLQLGVGRWIHITIVALMILLLFLIYSYLNHKKPAGKMINVMFTFLLSGALCSLIDKVFWDGSLDYIMLKGFFTFDLKDIYIDVSMGIIILLAVTKNKELEKSSEKEMVKDFAGFVKKGFLFGRRYR